MKKKTSKRGKKLASPKLTKAKPGAVVEEGMVGESVQMTDPKAFDMLAQAILKAVGVVPKRAPGSLSVTVKKDPELAVANRLPAAKSVYSELIVCGLSGHNRKLARVKRHALRAVMRVQLEEDGFVYDRGGGGWIKRHLTDTKAAALTAKYADLGARYAVLNNGKCIEHWGFRRGVKPPGSPRQVRLPRAVRDLAEKNPLQGLSNEELGALQEMIEKKLNA